MKNIMTSLCLALFIISASVTITLNFRPLYYHDISALKIEETSGFSKNIIKKNYDELIDYNQFFHSGKLKLTMPMSREGRIHFEDVKRIFDTIEIACVITLILSCYLVTTQIRKRDLRFLKISSIITILLPTIAGIMTAINWEAVFIMFHKIMFRNDYWLFDEALDPVITILPDTFFLQCAVMIILLILLGVLAFVRPNAALTGLVFVYGIAAIVMGIADIILYIQVERYTGFVSYLSLISGILSVMSGIMLLVYPGTGMVVLTVLFPIWFIAHCISRLVHINHIRYVAGKGIYYFSLVVNIIGLILGFMMFLRPLFTLTVISYLAGAYLILLGIDAIVIAFSRVGRRL